MNTVAEKKPRLTTSAMIASIAGEGQRVKAAPFGKALVELAANRPEIVGMTADLAKYTDLHIFAKAHPDRFYQMGMAEQLLMMSAAGMALFLMFFLVMVNQDVQRIISGTFFGQ